MSKIAMQALPDMSVKGPNLAKACEEDGTLRHVWFVTGGSTLTWPTPGSDSGELVHWYLRRGMTIPTWKFIMGEDDLSLKAHVSVRRVPKHVVDLVNTGVLNRRRSSAASNGLICPPSIAKTVNPKHTARLGGNDKPTVI